MAAKKRPAGEQPAGPQKGARRDDCRTPIIPDVGEECQA